MKIRRSFVWGFVGASVIVGAFSCGVAVAHYKVFPYGFLRAVKQFVSPVPVFLTYSDYYHYKVAQFAQDGAGDYDVVFIGDSITEGMDCQALFPSRKTANRAIIGDRTDGVLKRMDSIYATRAKTAFIMLGINDFSNLVPLEQVFRNYQEIVGNLLAHGMRVCIQSTILAGHPHSEANVQVRALNERLEKLAADNPMVTFIDLNAHLNTRETLLDAKYTDDGIHLNRKGYAVWKEALQGFLP